MLVRALTQTLIQCITRVRSAIGKAFIMLELPSLYFTNGD